MFPFPPPPTGGTGGMTANQMPQPMMGGAQQPMQQPMMPQGGMPQGGMQGGGMQQMPPISPQSMAGIDPQQLAALRLLLQQQQQPGNLRSMLGL